ncbi:MAG: hypothetical protein J6Y47_03680 [Bacteroidales bacterium]|nr:hypothetical protein [Bacteroidales bacterium]
MKNIIAKTFSVLLHPTMVFAILFITITYLRYRYTPYTVVMSIINMGICMTVCLLLLIICYKTKWIKSISLKNRSDRPIGYLCFALPLIIWMFCPTYGNAFTTLLIRVSIPALYTILIVSIFWKMSAHLFFFGTVIGILYTLVYRNAFPLYFWWIILIMILLAGCLGASRLYLKAHTPAQIYTGFTLGWLQASVITALLL